jgi:glycosyltransferase involved in cell wall biosynthesis
MKEIMKSLISVIIPLYNKEESIQSTINSVLNQSFKNIEVLIIDDGSTDNSLKVLSSIDDIRLRIISKPNGGVSDARHYGVKNATSEYIFFLDADDIIHVDCLNVFVNLINRYKNMSVFVANFKIIYGNNNEITYCKGNNETLVNRPLKALWNRKIFPRTGSMLIKRACFKQIGYFKTDITMYEDLEFIIRLIKKYKVVYSPEVVLLYLTEYSTLSNSVMPLSKEFSYHIKLNRTSLYERLILAEHIYNSFVKRLKVKDQAAKKYLIKNNRKHMLFIVFAHLYNRLINIWYKFQIFSFLYNKK